MKIEPTHTMRFECENEDMLPEVRDPVYIYKEGDEIHMEDLYEKDDDKILIGDFKVVDVKHTLQVGFDGDQEIIVFLERIEET